MYNTEGKGGNGQAEQLADGRTHVLFDIEGLYIPATSFNMTKILGVPLPLDWRSRWSPRCLRVLWNMILTRCICLSVVSLRRIPARPSRDILNWHCCAIQSNGKKSFKIYPICWTALIRSNSQIWIDVVEVVEQFDLENQIQFMPPRWKIHQSTKPNSITVNLFYVEFD